MLIIPMSAVYAYTVPNTNQVGWSGALTDNLILTIANGGDLIVVNAEMVDASSGAKTSISVASVTDSQGNLFSQAVRGHQDTSSNCAAASPPCLDSEIWYAVATSSGSDTITLTQSQAAAAGSNMEVEDVAGLPGTFVTGTAIGSGTGTSVYTTSTTVVITGAFADSSIYDGCRGSGVFSAGTNYIALPGVTTTAGDAEYGNPALNPASPTNFPSGCTTTGTWIDVGAAFGFIPTSTLVQGCNFFQLQCWAFPLMFFGMYEGFFIGPALAFRFSEKGFLYFVLAGGTVASLVEISLGIMTPMVPIMLVVVNLAYSFRLDRLITNRGSSSQ